MADHKGGLLCGGAHGYCLWAPAEEWIMDIVWPITPLYSGPLGLAAYFWFGHQGTGNKGKAVLANSRCGSDSRQRLYLGDITAGWLTFAFPLVLWGEKIFGEWVVAYAFAYAFRIGFQYFTICGMEGGHSALLPRRRRRGCCTDVGCSTPTRSAVRT